MGVTRARKSQQRAQRCAARLNKLCMRLRHACVRRQVSREQEGLRAYAELQRKHRDAYGDNEEAREAAGKEKSEDATSVQGPTGPNWQLFQLLGALPLAVLCGVCAHTA